MKLFHWHSVYLKQYSLGDIIVMAEEVDAARALARTEFEQRHLKKVRSYGFSYSSLDELVTDEEERADFEEARKVFEADIAKEPMEPAGFVFIDDGE